MVESFYSHPALVWVAIALCCFLLEVALPSFGFIFAALAALIASLASVYPIGWEFQVLIFCGALSFGFFLLRPRIISKIQGSVGVPSRTEALVGKHGKVTETLDLDSASGRILVEGQDWAAKSTQTLAAGTSIIVTGADGIVLIVQKE
jgi:membrane protein implicated in regulation of membrane protease activity